MLFKHNVLYFLVALKKININQEKGAFMISTFLKYFIPLAITQPLLANEKEIPILDARHIKIDLKKSIFVDYQSKAWNKNPDQEDSAFLVLRDAVSGQTLSLEVRETEPNSSLFVGQYQLDFKSTQSEFTLEVYSPPQSLKNDTNKIAQITNLIKEGILLRKPYFFRVENQKQKITLFDSKSQALEAYRYFIRTGQSAQVLNPNLLEAQARAQIESPPLVIVKPETDISNYEAILLKQKMEREEAQKKLSEEKRKAQALEAQKASDLAMSYYQKEQIKEALEKFDQALALDPTNKSFYFQYGVTLYRLNQHEKSLAFLNQIDSKTKPERDFFIGLNHLKLEENEKALNSFALLSNHPELGAPSTFYRGVIEFSRENLDPAQAHFEKVLESSKDPKMDAAADNYIEQILNLRKYKELQSKKWTLTGNLGLNYDSNILTVSPDALPLDLNGFRALYGFSIEYRPIFTEKHEFLTQLTMGDMYSVDSTLQSNSTFQNTDPLSLQLTLPYRWKGKINEKVSQVGVTPSLKSAQMNADGVGQREEILQSIGVTTDLTLVSSADKTQNYAVELRQDDSKISTTENENQDATYLGLLGTWTRFIDPNDQSKALIWDAGLGLNLAQGSNQKYQSLSLGAGYLQPGYWKALWIGKLGLTFKNFSEHSNSRQDVLLTGLVLAQKQINSHLQASGSLSYNKSQSNIEAVTFDQFILMAQLTWQTSF